MIGLSILVVIVGYIFLSKFIINKTYEKYGTKKAKYIAIAIMVLIPTWDIVLGYPIYAYFCLTKAGVHIYKTVDNVEGFYVGEKDVQYEPYEPYKGYKYIEYQEVRHQKPTGKYYRSYWVNFWEDTQSSKLCVSPRRDNDDYAKAVKKGHCIVKEEIAEEEVTGLWKVSKKNIQQYSILYLNISSIAIEVIDPRTKEKYFTAQDYIVDRSWITAVNIVTGNKNRQDCIGIANNQDNHINTFFIMNTLKPRKGDK